MIPTIMRDQMFELHMQNFERNQMYPPNHKETTMVKKLKHDHVMAVHTAQLFLHKALDRTHEPRFQKEVESDIALLGELRLILIHAIANPHLPFEELEITSGPEDGTS